MSDQTNLQRFAKSAALAGLVITAAATAEVNVLNYPIQRSVLRISPDVAVTREFMGFYKNADRVVPQKDELISALQQNKEGREELDRMMKLGNPEKIRVTIVRPTINVERNQAEIPVTLERAKIPVNIDRPKIQVTIDRGPSPLADG